MLMVRLDREGKEEASVLGLREYSSRICTHNREGISRGICSGGVSRSTSMVWIGLICFHFGFHWFLFLLKELIVLDVI